MNTAIIMTTYYPKGDAGAQRLENAKKVLKSLRILDSFDGSSRIMPNLIIADDGSPTEHLNELIPYYPTHLTQFVTGPHAGVGASINRALKVLDDTWKHDYAWIYMPDDLLLTRQINLLKASALFKYYDFVRLDLPHPELFCKTKFEQDLGWWFELCYTNRDFVFATRPTLISSRVHHEVGLFKEMADSYEVELDYSRRVQAVNLKGALVCDVGDTWQHLSTEKEAIGYLPINS